MNITKLASVFFAGFILLLTACNDTNTSTPVKGVDHAFKHQISDLMVSGEGEIVAILKDDLEGSRHQKFILKLPSGLTILIAHNIDLAPRVPNPKKGTTLRFYGEYEWTEKGGVVHWTHHDPVGKHAAGWLEYQGKKYQ